MKYKETYTANSMRVINNPLKRFNKYPIILESLMEMSENSKKIDFQIAYVLSTRLMKNYMDDYDLLNKEISLLTNSEYSSSNIFAMSGYIGAKKKL